MTQSCGTGRRRRDRRCELDRHRAAASGGSSHAWSTTGRASGDVCHRAGRVAQPSRRRGCAGHRRRSSRGRRNGAWRSRRSRRRRPRRCTTAAAATSSRGRSIARISAGIERPRADKTAKPTTNRCSTNRFSKWSSCPHDERYVVSASMASTKIGPATRNHPPTMNPTPATIAATSRSGERSVVDRFVEPGKDADAGETAGRTTAELEQHREPQHEVRQGEHPERDAERRQAFGRRGRVRTGGLIVAPSGTWRERCVRAGSARPRPGRRRRGAPSPPPPRRPRGHRSARRSPRSVRGTTVADRRSQLAGDDQRVAAGPDHAERQALLGSLIGECERRGERHLAPRALEYIGYVDNGWLS